MEKPKRNILFNITSRLSSFVPTSLQPPAHGDEYKDQYIQTSGKWLLENGFFEKEIGRKTDQFGNMAQVFSTYESFKTKSDTKPFMRGINSIQLLNDGKRWWIINIFWQGETPNQPIPKKYID